MTEVVGVLLLLAVAAVAGMFGQVIAGRKVAGGWLGTVVLGIVGAWLGSALVPFGPYVAGIQVVSAVAGAALLVLVLALLGGQPASRRPVNRRWGTSRRLVNRLVR